jgi:hypothetical protein
VFLSNGTERKLISGIDDRSPVLRDRRRGPPGASPP